MMYIIILNKQEKWSGRTWSVTDFAEFAIHELVVVFVIVVAGVARLTLGIGRFFASLCHRLPCVKHK